MKQNEEKPNLSMTPGTFVLCAPLFVMSHLFRFIHWSSCHQCRRLLHRSDVMGGGWNKPKPMVWSAKRRVWPSTEAHHLHFYTPMHIIPSIYLVFFSYCVFPLYIPSGLCSETSPFTQQPTLILRSKCVIDLTSAWLQIIEIHFPLFRISTNVNQVYKNTSECMDSNPRVLQVISQPYIYMSLYNWEMKTWQILFERIVLGELKRWQRAGLQTLAWVVKLLWKQLNLFLVPSVDCGFFFCVFFFQKATHFSIKITIF